MIFLVITDLALFRLTWMAVAQNYAMGAGMLLLTLGAGICHLLALRD
jgi:hypothetical protein